MRRRVRGAARWGGWTAGAAGWLALLACGCARRADLVLIVIDTVRTDRMSLHGYEQKTTPHLERLGAEGVVFEQAVTHVPQTLPAVATLLTSTLPAEHGVRVNGLFRLREASVTLAEVLRDAGYATAAFVSGFSLDARFRADQGFDVYDADFRSSVLTRSHSEGFAFQGELHHGFEQRADEATSKALAWLEARRPEDRERPFFLLVHYFDPHHPYDPPPAYRSGLDPYDGELTFVDAEIGRLLDRLRDAGLLDRALVVVAGDHGELLDPARPNARHAGYLKDAVLRVPLLLRSRSALPTGARIAAQVGLVDLAPTILELLGLPAPGEFRGASLVPLVRGARAGGSPRVPFETLYWKLEVDRGLVRHGIRTEKYKYVRNVREANGSVRRTEELYDLEHDPEERANLAPRASQAAATRDALEALRRELAEPTHEGFAEPLPLTPDAEEKLRSLGYLGS